MPQQETEGRILAADEDEEEKELGKLKTHMLNKYSTVFSDTINEKPIAGTPMKIHYPIRKFYRGHISCELLGFLIFFWLTDYPCLTHRTWSTYYWGP
jgi:hypothetical protein